MNPVQFVMQPNVIKGLGLVGSITSLIISGKNIAQMKEIDKRWWYAGLAAVAIAGIVIATGMKSVEQKQ
jgi:hypothetical protein